MDFLNYKSQQHLKEILKGKTPAEYLTERGLVKTSFGWIKREYIARAQYDGAIVKYDGLWGFVDGWNPSEVFRYLKEGGTLSRPIVAPQKETVSSRWAKEFEDL